MLITSALYIGAAALIALLLTLNVSRLRWKHRALYGYGNAKTGEVKELRRAVRAHGNFVENAPLLLLILAALELTGGGSTQIHLLGALALFGRAGHAVAMLAGGPFMLRAFSVMATWAAYAIGGALLLLRALEGGGAA